MRQAIAIKVPKNDSCALKRHRRSTCQQQIIDTYNCMRKIISIIDEIDEDIMHRFFII